MFKTIRKNVTKKQYETIMDIVDRFDENQYYEFTNKISLDLKHHFSTSYGFRYEPEYLLMINGEPIVNGSSLYLDMDYNIRYSIIVDTNESTVDKICGTIESNQNNYVEINITSKIKYIYKTQVDGRSRCIYNYKNQEIIISKIPFYTLYITNKFEYKYTIMPFTDVMVCDIAYPGDILVFEVITKYTKYAPRYTNVIFKLPDIFEINETQYSGNGYNGYGYYISLQCDDGWIQFSNDNSILFKGPNFESKILKMRVVTHGEFWKKMFNESREQVLSLKNINSVGIRKKDIFISQVQEMTGRNNDGTIGPVTMKKIKEYMSGLDQNKDEIPIRKRTYNNIIYENFNLISDISPAFAYAGSVVFLKSYNKFFTYDAFTESWIPIDTEVSGIYGESNNKPSIGFGIHYDAPSHTSAYNTGGYTRGINIEEEVRGYEYDEDIVPTEKEIQAANKTVNEENENNIKDILKEMNGKLNSSFNHELT